MPVPIASRMHRGVHSGLHSIKIMSLVRQLCIIVRNHLRIHCSKNNRDIRAHRMHSTLAKIKKLCKAFWRDIRGSSALLHLLVATLHCICSSLGRIVKSIRIKEAITARLTVSEHYMNALVMVGVYNALQHRTNLANHRARAAGWVAKAHPGNTWIGNLRIPLYAKYRFWMEFRGRCGCPRWCRCLCRLPCSTYLNLAGGQQYTTNQHRSKDNQELPLHVSPYFSG